MKIVVLDGYCQNPGDLSWNRLKKWGDVTVYDRTPPPLIEKRIACHEVVIVNKTPLTRDTILACPSIRYIGVLATGYNVVDIEAAREKGIPVCNAPGYATDAVAQHMFALLLSLSNRIPGYGKAVEEGEWAKSPDFSLFKEPITELSGLTMGFLGLGQIGTIAADIAKALGMRVIAHHASRPPAFVEMVHQDALLQRSDILSLCCPLNEQTKGFICKNNLKKMKDGVMLINIARGTLIVEEDLAEALKNGKVSAFGADVLSLEPPVNNPLIGLKNTLITPHVAWASKAARMRLMDMTCDNLEAFLQGKTKNAVNGL
ncbi:MAG TPA: glycerate dehydrogenase [Clostridiales bacterium]|nr:glycerate dehydrogenase [Clostridiales bacterium]